VSAFSWITQLLYVLARARRDAGTLRGPVVGTVMSNLGLEHALGQLGIEFHRARVGDRHVLATLNSVGGTLGGETSGHILCLDKTTTGDGLVTALELLRIMKSRGEPLSKLRLGMKKYPQLLVNLDVRERIPLDQLPEVTETVKAIEKELGSNGRILLRYSGTEPKIRLLVETRDEALLQPVADRVLAPIKKHLAAE